MRLLPTRTALATTAVGCLVLLYLLWWTTYAGTHLEPRFTAAPPGGSATVSGTTVRMLSWTTSPLLAQEAYGGGPDMPEPAKPGTVWVVAELEAVQTPEAPDFGCALALVGTEGRPWEPTGVIDRARPSCDRELISERPSRFEAVFSVPAVHADRLMGVAVLDSSVADRTPVLTPAR